MNEINNLIIHELNEQAQALTGAGCSLELLCQELRDHGEAGELARLAQAGLRQAIRSHRRLVRLAQALGETGDDQV